MIQFHKISDEQLKKDWEALHWPMEGENSLEDAVIKIPQRATVGSAGYDICSPINLLFRPGVAMTIPTGLKVELHPLKFLMIVPRSGLGFKYQMCLANTVGIIDEDYFNNPDNEGHILIRMVNRGTKDCRILAGQAFCQGIIMDYNTCHNDLRTSETRKGGFGSTDK